MRSAVAVAGLALALLAGCSLDLTGATCNTNENCPVRQYCAVPAGAKQGSCQIGERISAELLLTANPSLLPAGGTTQAVAILTAQGGPPVPDGGLVTDLVAWSVAPGSEDLISVGNDAGSRGLVVALRPGQGVLTGTITFAGKLVEGSTTIVVSNAALTRLVVVADRVQYAAGTAGSATATGFFSDGSHADLTSLVKWTSSAPTVLGVSTASGTWGRLSAVTPGMAVIQASYLELGGSTSVTVTNAKLSGLSISPLQPQGVEGIDLAVDATGLFSDGSAQPMTRSVQWSVDDQSIGYFSSPGIVTLLTPGSTTVRALASNIEAQAELDVSPLAPVQLEISPAWPDALELGGSTRLFAWITHQDGTVYQSPSDWEAASPLAVSTLGEVSALSAPGVGVVTAKASGLDATAAFETTSAGVESWQVWPPELVVPLGAEGRLAAERILETGIVQDLSGTAGWRPQDLDGGSIDVDNGEHGGTVRTREPGTRMAVVAVAPGALVRAWVRAPAGTPTLEIVPPAGTVPVGGRNRLAAVGHWPDGTVVDVTAAASWSATPDGILAAGDGPSAGLVLGADAGASTLRARFGAASAQAQVQSEPGSGTLEAWPPALVLAAGTALPVALTLVTDSGDSVDVTADAVWRSNSPKTAIVTNAPGQRGMLLGRAAGSTTLIARVDRLQISLPVMVTSAGLQHLDVHPPSAVVSWAPSHFAATGRFSDGTSQDLTELVTWAPSERSVLRIRGTGSDRGTARGIDAGTVQVLAHPVGGTTISVGVTVNASPPTSLAVLLPDGGVAVGTRAQVAALARSSDGATVDVTALVEWSSSDPTLATVSSVVRPGSVSTLRVGAPTMTARFAGLTAGVPLQIRPDALTRLSVTAPGDLSVGAADVATATATLSGGGTQLLGDDVVWSVDRPDVLGVSNAPGARGRILGVGPGTATLQARTRSGLPALQATTSVSVSAPGLRASHVGAARPQPSRQ
ncbi:MAG TPA: hypothetical protein VFF12_00825 [Myxococcaceae bacterium]|nr:hypothetical protein [Myxococcaceae bacterium]